MSLDTIQGKLSRAEMKSIMAGALVMGGGTCYLRCNQNSTSGQEVSDCSRATAQTNCSDISNAVCICTGG